MVVVDSIDVVDLHNFEESADGGGVPAEGMLADIGSMCAAVSLEYAISITKLRIHWQELVVGELCTDSDGNANAQNVHALDALTFLSAVLGLETSRQGLVLIALSLSGLNSSQREGCFPTNCVKLQRERSDFNSASRR